MNPETVSFSRYGGSTSLMKVEGIDLRANEQSLA
jgi:hypothetical protein